MSIELSKFEFKDDLTSANFNAKIEEVENYLNNKVQFERAVLTVELLNNADYKDKYEGVINFGKQIGLIGNWCHIKYFANPNEGYGTQMAIPYDDGKFTSIFIREATYNAWNGWQDLRTMRDPDHSCDEYNQLLDANDGLESGKLYYCKWAECINLPFTQNSKPNDGLIIPFMHVRGVWGCQIYFVWNYEQEIWTRYIVNGQWQSWKCLSGVKWDFPVESDNESISKFMRWSRFGTNHVLFDASAGVTPTGRECHKLIPELYHAEQPSLMGWNGDRTYGVRVGVSNWSDSTGNIHGIPFRNQGGWLEVLEHGVWRRVTQ